jgi:hypothetical protein
MAALSTDYASYISADVYDRLNADSKYGPDGTTDMWTRVNHAKLGYTVYGSNWIWPF